MHLSALSRELCGEARPLLFQPRLQAQQAGPDNWDGVGGVALRASWELPAYKGLRDKALSKQFSLEKLHLKRRAAAAHGQPTHSPDQCWGTGRVQGAHLAASPNPLWCPAPRKKNLRRKAGRYYPFSVPIKLTNMQNFRPVCMHRLGMSYVKSTQTYACLCQRVIPNCLAENTSK